MCLCVVYLKRYYSSQKVVLNVGIKDFCYTMNILASDFFETNHMIIFVNQKFLKLAFKTGFSIHNIKSFLCTWAGKEY